MGHNKESEIAKESSTADLEKLYLIFEGKSREARKNIQRMRNCTQSKMPEQAEHTEHEKLR